MMAPTTVKRPLLIRPLSADSRASVGTVCVRKSQSRGFSLMEVLVTVIIISVGLLGVAALQSVGLRNGLTAYQRTQATMLAYDMSDRMRANRAGFDNDAYHLPAHTETPACHTPAGCTAQEMANQDNFDWQELLEAHLPLGQGVVCRDGTPDDGTGAASPACDDNDNANYVIKLWWEDRSDDNDNNNNLDAFLIMEFQP